MRAAHDFGQRPGSVQEHQVGSIAEESEHELVLTWVSVPVADSMKCTDHYLK
jgi:hypothetical protein